MTNRLIQDLIARRFPQYLAAYLGASWALVEFFAFLEDRFLLSPYWTNLVLLTVALLLPSVGLFIYFHGRKGRDRWHRVEKVAIPVNIARVPDPPGTTPPGHSVTLGETEAIILTVAKGRPGRPFSYPLFMHFRHMIFSRRPTGFVISQWFFGAG